MPVNKHVHFAPVINFAPSRSPPSPSSPSPSPPPSTARLAPLLTSCALPTVIDSSPPFPGPNLSTTTDELLLDPTINYHYSRIAWAHSSRNDFERKLILRYERQFREQEESINPVDITLQHDHNARTEVQLPQDAFVPPQPTTNELCDQQRPASISELTERALDYLYDENKSFKYYLRIADRCRNEAKDYNSKGDLENAFILLTRTAALVLEKLPSHQGYHTLLKPSERSNLNMVCTYYLPSVLFHSMLSSLFSGYPSMILLLHDLRAQKNIQDEHMFDVISCVSAVVSYNTFQH